MESKNVQLSLSPEELEELTRMVYIAQFVIDTSADVYATFPIMEALCEKINKLGYEFIPGSGLCEKALPDEAAAESYSHTIKMEEECQAVLDAFGDEVFYECISTQLADSDFIEKYGKVETETFYNTKALYDSYFALESFYEEELRENGLSRLRVIA
jgi:hypothetical protein